MKKWKEGDKVMVDDSDSFFHGREGVVVFFNEDLIHNVYVRFNNNDLGNFRHKELKGVDHGDIA